MHTVEKWRYHCPRGHTSWEAHRNVFSCSECDRYIDGTGTSFREVIDRKTGERLTPGEFAERRTRGHELSGV